MTKTADRRGNGTTTLAHAPPPSDYLPAATAFSSSRDSRMSCGRS